MEVDFLHGGDLAGLYESTELGDGGPSLLLVPSTALSGALVLTTESSLGGFARGCSSWSRHCSIGYWIGMLRGKPGELVFDRSNNEEERRWVRAAGENLASMGRERKNSLWSKMAVSRAKRAVALMRHY